MRFAFITVLLALLTFPTLTFAHGESAEGPQLHVGDAYDSCYFDLHPELTQGQLQEFTREAAGIARFHQLDSARTLGRLNFDIALSMSWTPIDDSKGAWNNMFSHPDDEHWLGEVQSVPRLQARIGATDWLDFGIWGSADPNSNYGFVGVESKVALLRQMEGWPVDFALRPHATTLIGPSELRFWTASTDASVSRTFFGTLAPYVGVGGSMSVATETSDDVDLDTAVAFAPVAVAGLAVNWKFFSAGVEAEWSEVTTYSVRVGGRF